MIKAIDISVDTVDSWKRDVPGVVRDKFESLLPWLRAAAEGQGWTLGVRGIPGIPVDSIELIGVRWKANPAGMTELVEAVRMACSEWDNGYLRGVGGLMDRAEQPEFPGRVLWIIHLGGGPHIRLWVVT